MVRGPSIVAGVIASCATAAIAFADDSGPPPAVAFNDGIVFSDGDKRYQVRLRFRSQNWAVLRSDDLTDVAVDGVTVQPRRLRLRLNGWVADPRVVYAIQLGFTRADMDWDGGATPHIVRDATVGVKVAPDLQILFGQTKLPGNRQRVVSSGDQQFPDRSIANRDYNLDRDFGLQAHGQVRFGGALALAKAAVSGGEGRNAGSGGDSGLAYTVRGEVLPMGHFTGGGDYFEGDLAREAEPRVSVGGGVHWNRGARRTQGTLGSATAVGRDLRSLFADLVVKWRGAAVSAEWLRRDCDQPDVALSSGKAGQILVGQAWNVQASYLWSDKFETALRASDSTPAETIAVHVARTRQLGLGVSYYLIRHRVKLQADLTAEVKDQPARDREGAWIARLNSEVGL